MVEIIGVRFKKAGRIYYFDPGEAEVSVGDGVIVETIRGIEYGRVVIGRRLVPEEDVVLPLRPLIRRADAADEAVVAQNREDANRAIPVARELIAAHGLPMRLIDAEYTFDRAKLIFYFAADGRVDFRALVRDLAAVFRTRIELRQIGVRDQAKLIGGIGPCGRVLCCSSFLGEFEPVTIKMAKDQNLVLNPTKISGLCGRLMCCLTYENDQYESAREMLPDLGEEIETPYGSGRVVGLNLLDRIVQIALSGGQTVELPWESLVAYWQERWQ
ncbi:stage 0 sporulation family protein [Hydrogenibacillus schlegelii]|uniref:Stage 0 sporulation protein n=1 Tax=Hydrogenibacillus schlegelii TaxID=1484 RepID=A0A132NEF6_HYDSH|nr:MULTISPECIES: stage 0 sporulation family protein [Hydrogenibacillus]KWX08449.1 stage 0 sporulation protein [Hydrogenibacillus schlegelii]OAR04128.1 stage 0 sporulation protein [Hydrogenibacillus schlegelii]QZA33050.1 stage 0 sporulation family protein [Hydrogenibacillus sp. N12]